MSRGRWVPDEEGSGCSLCHSDFSLTRRRHHCRRCGVLVCGSCSDHFVVLPSVTTEVRVCDACDIEMREASAASEKMDVTSQITSSLKQALKEKTIEAELFNTFFQHMTESESDTTSSPLSNDAKVVMVKESVDNLCEWLQQVTTHYNDLKMSSIELERDIRTVAQRCIRAEEQTREALAISRQIEEYSGRIGAQARLIDQLTERIDRLSNSRSSPSLPRSPPPHHQRRVEVTELATTPDNRASFCDVLRSLLSISSID